MNMKKLEKYGCVVTMSGGKLLKCKLLSDGSPEIWAGMLSFYEVKLPVQQDFLDAVNEVLGLHLTVENFK